MVRSTCAYEQYDWLNCVNPSSSWATQWTDDSQSPVSKSYLEGGLFIRGQPGPPTEFENWWRPTSWVQVLKELKSCRSLPLRRLLPGCTLNNEAANETYRISVYWKVLEMCDDWDGSAESVLVADQYCAKRLNTARNWNRIELTEKKHEMFLLESWSKSNRRKKYITKSYSRKAPFCCSYTAMYCVSAKHYVLFYRFIFIRKRLTRS